ncbi:thiol reductant ABC exporter subunit CydC [Asaia bogorensis]|uniref:Cysteine/glutathione ABC transporter ATP-binding protein/permease CydC n=1 Tax=Asaia bogorensis NBRC 16594 TaxID=1231624 RepID=A0AAN4U309_9PROT|nr:thiol reductant ABC exporter subunit CydC [Asaia bogorensis]BAT19524.1 ABC transporter cysteine exporter CydCD [Asaia bogorensis NBRC 16594]GBQ78503.1 transport ATP-binding protein CydD [Asaia bogorensis NBRC 16594]GEL53982.1 cysteine/glutathione ABC transporter ATP-binding protein/permease CydC [Asaia bogorensis NBRC 16594]
MSTRASHPSPSATPSVGQALGIILRVWRPYGGRLLLGLILSALALLSGMALMWNAGARVTSLALGMGAALGLLRAFGCARIVLRYAERLFAHDAMFRALAALRVWFFRNLASGAAAGLGFRRAGDLLNRLVGDVELLDNLYLRIAMPMLGIALSLPVIALVAGYANWRFGLALSGLFIVAACVVPVVSARRAASRSAVILHAESSLRVAAVDLATGLREARAFGGESRLAERLMAEEARLHGAQLDQARAMAGAGAVSYLCGQAALVLILVGLAGFGKLTLDYVSGIALIFLTGMIFESIGTLTRTSVLATQVGQAAQRVVEVAEAKPSAAGTHCPAPEAGDLVLRDVTFGWDPARAPVLKGIDLTIRAGEHIALVGPSGAGKSSLAALLLKVAHPQSGQILFGGHDLSTIETTSLRGQIGWLSQSTHLFADTIRNNLLLGREGVSDEALWAALERAEMAETVQSLPDGLDSWVGEGGTRLSGGQGRRIALARTLLRDTPIVILDEPATGLDSVTERAFLRTLGRTMQGRTVILIAHRLKGLENLDRAWRIEAGTLAPLPL